MGAGWLPDLWKWIDENGAGLAAVATIATAAVAMVALLHAAADSRARSRPMMIAELREAEHSDRTIMLVVRNAGPSVAREVRVTFDPQITLPDDTSQLVTPFLLRRYERPLPVVAPGQELANIWFTMDGEGEPNERGDLPNFEPIPDRVTLVLAYRGSGRRRYMDSFRLDVDLIRMTTYATSTDSMPGRIDGIHKSLASLKVSAQEIAKAARYIRREEIAEDAARRSAQAARIKELVQPHGGGQAKPEEDGQANPEEDGQANPEEDGQANPEDGHVKSQGDEK